MGGGYAGVGATSTAESEGTRGAQVLREEKGVDFTAAEMNKTISVWFI